MVGSWLSMLKCPWYWTPNVGEKSFIESHFTQSIMRHTVKYCTLCSALCSWWIILDKVVELQEPLGEGGGASAPWTPYWAKLNRTESQIQSHFSTHPTASHTHTHANRRGQGCWLKLREVWLKSQITHTHTVLNWHSGQKEISSSYSQNTHTHTHTACITW